MDAFDPRAVDKNFNERTRQRQFVNLLTVQLEGKIRLALLIQAVLEQVGAQRVEHKIDEPAQDPVFIQAAHLVQ